MSGGVEASPDDGTERSAATDPDRTAFGSLPEPGRVGTLRFVNRTLRRDVTDGLALLAAEYGTPVRFGLPGSNLDGVIVADPERVEHVLETNQTNYRKPDTYFEMLEHLGDSIITTQGDTWRAQHRALVPMFQADSVFGFTDVIARQTAETIDRWRTVADRGGTVDVEAAMHRLTLSIIGRTMFSSDVDAFSEEFSAAADALRERMAREQSPVPYPDGLLERRYREPVATLERIAARLIRDRRGREAEYDDLLTMMMAAGEDGGMSDERVVDNVVAFLLAGHETTALALTWTWYLLARHPAAQRRVHLAALDAEIHDGAVTPETIEELAAVKRAIQESMRLFPPVPFFSRETVEDDTVGGVEVPADTMLLVSQFLTHRDQSLWDEPLGYRPGRFDTEAATDHPAYSFYPFGGGARMCIGRAFALLEAQLVVALIASELRLELESPHAGVDIDVTTAVTMAPDPEVRMAVHERA